MWKPNQSNTIYLLSLCVRPRADCKYDCQFQHWPFIFKDCPLWYWILDLALSCQLQAATCQHLATFLQVDVLLWESARHKDPVFGAIVWRFSVSQPKRLCCTTLLNSNDHKTFLVIVIKSDYPKRLLSGISFRLLIRHPPKVPTTDWDRTKRLCLNLFAILEAAFPQSHTVHNWYSPFEFGFSCFRRLHKHHRWFPDGICGTRIRDIDSIGWFIGSTKRHPKMLFATNTYGGNMCSHIFTLLY